MFSFYFYLILDIGLDSIAEFGRLIWILEKGSFNYMLFCVLNILNFLYVELVLFIPSCYLLQDICCELLMAWLLLYLLKHWLFAYLLLSLWTRCGSLFSWMSYLIRYLSSLYIKYCSYMLWVMALPNLLLLFIVY